VNTRAARRLRVGGLPADSPRFGGFARDLARETLPAFGRSRTAARDPGKSGTPDVRRRKEPDVSLVLWLALDSLNYTMPPMRFFKLLILTLIALTPQLVHAQREKFPMDDLDVIEKRFPNAKKTSTSLRTVLIQEGSGPHPQPGDVVEVLYTGKLLDGTVFDQSNDRAHPFSFRLGRGLVIQGWEEGLQLMKPGEKRILIVPYELGYGSRGNLPKIPRKASLIFDVELLAVKKE
jgi:FKBP-type peptidyl-prolyl cis-trans isomerase